MLPGDEGYFVNSNNILQIMNVTKNSNDTDFSDDNTPSVFEWLYPSTWPANSSSEQVLWNNTGNVVHPTASDTFTYATVNLERPVIMATGTYSTSFTLASITVYSGEFQMMGYYRTAAELQALAPTATITTDDFLWQGRIVAKVGSPDDSSLVLPAIIEFDSLRGVSSFTIAMGRTANPISLLNINIIVK
jgi:hypothetical protein